MARYLTLSSTFIFSILFLIPIIESSRCSKKCTFPALSLNSSIPSDFCPSSNVSNDSSDDINQDCAVKLSIDLTAGFVSGSFESKNQTSWPENHLNIQTSFSLNDTSIEVNITYTCSMSDYCDLEFVRETLSPALAKVQLEPLRQKLADRLYNTSNTGPVECSNNTLCPQNTSLCQVGYVRQNGRYAVNKLIISECANLFDDPLVYIWSQSYTPYTTSRRTDLAGFYCNIPDCGSNATIMETVQWLTDEYILPVNISVINVTTTTPQPTTTTSTKGSTTITNYASILFGHFNIMIHCFVIIIFLY